MVQSAGSWKPDKELPTESKSCEHDWKENTVTNYIICYYCRILTTDVSRLNCPKCQLTTCALCARNYLGKTINVKGKQPHKLEEEKDFHSNEVRLLKELLKEKTEQIQQMIKDQAKEYYENRCKDTALAKELRDLSRCSAIPIPGYYKNNRKKYGIRISKQGNVARSAVYQELDLDDNWDIVSADFDDISVYSISKGEGDVHRNIIIMVQDTPFEEVAFMAILMKDRGSQTRNYQPKAKVVIMIGKKIRNYLGKTVNVKGKQPHKPEEEKDFHSNEVRLLKELLKEKMEQVQQMIKDQAKEYYENRAIVQRKEELWQSEKIFLLKDLTDPLKIIDQLKIEQIRFEEQKDEEIRKLKTQLQKEKEKEIEARYSSKEFPPLGNSQIARPFMEAEVHYSRNTTTAPKIRKITNQLYNVKATYRIKQGSFLIEGNKFKIPPIYAFDMNDSNGIEMLIGANFLRSMKGGIRIEGDEITIYKKVTRIATSNQFEVAEVAITELEVSKEEFMEINESIYFNQEGSKALLEQFKLVIERLKHQGYIGEEPLKN
ncbi:hypothetical protein Tco_0876525 [Tanacetum coccineum]|uniref:Uncharacterized protein n=1 Tax=Tanacetum coccineum TaxID=301880 RepID=A0ABQ5BXM2_9ASTR